MIFSKQSEFLSRLGKWGFNVNKLSKTIKDFDEIKKQHSYIDLSDQADYDIDGLVFSNDLIFKKD